MRRKAILLICTFLLCGCASSENNRVEENTTQSTEEYANSTDIHQNTPTSENFTEASDNVIIFGDNGKLLPVEGKIDEVFSFLPGHKKIPVEEKQIKTELEQVFQYIQAAEKRMGVSPLPQLDGAGVTINYDYEGQKVSLDMLSTYEDNYIMVNIDIDDGKMHYSELLDSEEGLQFIHKLSGWKEFDITQLSNITSMTAQVTFGYQSSNKIVTFSEEETRILMDQIITSAELTDEGSCGYNVEIKLYQNETLLYQGYLAGDSCPEIGLESQHFRINRDIVSAIYEKLDYDMDI